jgi:hypothetical protein
MSVFVTSDKCLLTYSGFGNLKVIYRISFFSWLRVHQFGFCIPILLESIHEANEIVKIQHSVTVRLYNE